MEQTEGDGFALLSQGEIYITTKHEIARTSHGQKRRGNETLLPNMSKTQSRKIILTQHVNMR